MSISKERLEALKQKHGADKVFVLERGGEQLAFRKASRAEYRRYAMRMQDPADRFDANEELVKACFVEPEPAALDTLLEEFPGLVTDLGGEIALVAGMHAKAEAKKA